MMSVGARVARRMTLVLIGVAIGVGLSLLVSRALASLLLGMEADRSRQLRGRRLIAHRGRIHRHVSAGASCEPI
jgi:hypothetical protein